MTPTIEDLITLDLRVGGVSSDGAPLGALDPDGVVLIAPDARSLWIA